MAMLMIWTFVTLAVFFLAYQVWVAYQTHRPFYETAIETMKAYFIRCFDPQNVRRGLLRESGRHAIHSPAQVRPKTSAPQPRPQRLSLLDRVRRSLTPVNVAPPRLLTPAAQAVDNAPSTLMDRIRRSVTPVNVPRPRLLTPTVVTIREEDEDIFSDNDVQVHTISSSSNSSSPSDNDNSKDKTYMHDSTTSSDESIPVVNNRRRRNNKRK